MNHLTRRSVIFYLSSIFLIGAVSGAAFAWGAARQKRFEQPVQHPPSMRDVCDHVKKRLQTHLDLTPEQMQRIEPILDSTSREMNAIHAKSMDQIEKILERQNAEISKELSPEQRLKFEQLEQERRDRRKNKGAWDPGSKR